MWFDILKTDKVVKLLEVSMGFSQKHFIDENTYSHYRHKESMGRDNKGFRVNLLQQYKQSNKQPLTAQNIDIAYNAVNRTSEPSRPQRPTATSGNDYGWS